ncbi:hypothetical protein JTM79_36270, partial [Pseudomonas aeruginosa]|nr:hypothetical protein [Pseudomonas aeruginosa]
MTALLRKKIRNAADAQGEARRWRSAVVVMGRLDAGRGGSPRDTWSCFRGGSGELSEGKTGRIGSGVFVSEYMGRLTNEMIAE